jgi:hypothetical protein
VVLWSVKKESEAETSTTSETSIPVKKELVTVVGDPTTATATSTTSETSIPAKKESVTVDSDARKASGSELTPRLAKILYWTPIVMGILSMIFSLVATSEFELSNHPSTFHI